MRLGVLASGRGSNLGSLLCASCEGRLASRVAVVLSDVDGAPALRRAREAGVPARYIPPGTSRTRLSPRAASAFVSALTEHDVDWVVLAGFMRVVGRTFFETFSGRILNIHPSLLPAFRGLEPQRQALEAGVAVAGCTVHVVVPAVDAGPIITQASVPVFAEDTVGVLSDRILREEHRLYVDAIRLIERGRVVIRDGRVHRLPDGHATAPEGEPT